MSKCLLTESNYVCLVNDLYLLDFILFVHIDVMIFAHCRYEMGQPRGVYTTSTYIRTVLLMIYTTVVSLVSAKIPAISFHVSQFPSTLAKFSMAILQHLLFACFHHFWCVLPLSNPKFNTALTSLLQG